MRITADGRLIIPVEFRNQLGLTPETEVSIEVDGDALRIEKVATSQPGKPRRKFSLKDAPFVGMWRDRDEMADSTEWVRRLRRDQWRSP
jgi:bifunctional DNA-binding transcriptional regulator/antitoxin component of YhaV-PrlF toxin-antitoxin module